MVSFTTLIIIVTVNLTISTLSLYLLLKPKACETLVKSETLSEKVIRTARGVYKLPKDKRPPRVHTDKRAWLIEQKNKDLF